jgi:hypothetical protein
MVKKITFYDKTEAIQYQLNMRRLGYVTKMIHPEGKYEVIVAGEAPEWKNPIEVENVSDASKNDI